MCVSDWRVNNNKKMEAEVRSWGGSKSVWSRSRPACSTEEIRTGEKCSGHRAALPKLHWPTSCPRVILSIVLFLLSAATWLFLSYNQSSANPYSCCMELFPLSFVCLPHWETLLKEILWEYGNKARYISRQTGSFLQTEQRTAKSRDTVEGKACDREGRRHRNNTTFGQWSNNILNWRIKAVPGSHQCSNLFISLQNKERKFNGWLNGEDSRLEP